MITKRSKLDILGYVRAPFYYLLCFTLLSFKILRCP
jgi:hypothetical protein